MLSLLLQDPKSAVSLREWDLSQDNELIKGQNILTRGVARCYQLHFKREMKHSGIK